MPPVCNPPLVDGGGLRVQAVRNGWSDRVCEDRKQDVTQHQLEHGEAAPGR
jgi:hypothetical protein